MSLVRPPFTTTVVLTDLHANARALRAAIQMLGPFPADHVIILGDLLTYGPDVEETLDLVEVLAERAPTDLLQGNHDDIYLDLLEGKTAYLDTLPGWLRESAEWTAARLDLASFRSRFFWRKELQERDWLFAHASPFGDYRYLNTDAEHADAARKLQERGFALGVFGHTHRAGIRVFNDATGADGARQGPEYCWRPAPGDRVIVNPGSLGQPRSNPPQTSLLRLTRWADRVEMEILPVDYDVAGHVAAVRALPFSEATRDKLASFFAPRA